MDTDIGDSECEQEQLDAQYLRTHIRNDTYWKRLGVYTADVHIFRRLSRWKSCQDFDPFQLSVPSPDGEQYYWFFAIWFPESAARQLERVLNNCRDQAEYRINLGCWDSNMDFEGGHGGLIEAIICDFATDPYSKTLNDLLRKYGEHSSRKRIREVLSKLSRPGGPLVRHHGHKYNLRIDVENTGGEDGDFNSFQWQ